MLPKKQRKLYLNKTSSIIYFRSFFDYETWSCFRLFTNLLQAFCNFWICILSVPPNKKCIIILYCNRAVLIELSCHKEVFSFSIKGNASDNSRTYRRIFIINDQTKILSTWSIWQTHYLCEEGGFQEDSVFLHRIELL